MEGEEAEGKGELRRELREEGKVRGRRERGRGYRQGRWVGRGEVDLTVFMGDRNGSEVNKGKPVDRPV